MAPRLSEPQSIFAGSAQQSSQDFSRLQMPQTPSIPLGNTIPAFPDNYNQAMTDRSRAPSAMVSGLRDTTSGFGIYGGAAQLGSGQTPSMAPATDAITSFGSPMASRTERIASPYGTGSTTLNPEQQAQRFQARQQAEQAGTMPRTPEQQKAMIADMRVKGAALGQERVANMEEFFKQKRAEQTALRQATSEAALAGMDPMAVRQARAAYNEKQPTSIAGIQKQYQEMLPTFNQPMEERIASVRAPFGLPSGGPQPSARSAFGGGMAQPMGATGSMAAGVMPPLLEPVLNPFGGISMMEKLSRSGQNPMSMLDKLKERMSLRMVDGKLVGGSIPRKADWYS
jgi:hypothetical protein